jgi:light-regulated signal transduction histidine kinase (bacteriophytochrome)
LSPFETKDGVLVSSAIRDITEQKRFEAELRHARDVAETASRELEAFSYSVAHDLRAPLRGINGFSAALIEELGDQLDGEAKGYLERISAGAGRMGHLIDALLDLSRVSRTELTRAAVNLTEVAHAVIAQLRAGDAGRVVEVAVADGLLAHGDPQLLRVLLENLLGNAWKFAGKREAALIEFGRAEHEGDWSYFVRDNGAGFDMAYAGKLFTPFQRLHPASEFAGTGIGLATVQRIVSRHGGRIWAEAVVERGAAFYFTLDAMQRGPT